MSINLKRVAHVQVTMSDSFKKQYIALLNQFLETLNSTIDGYVKAKEAHKGNPSFTVFIEKKINESLLKVEQFQGQISAAKKCEVGSPFLVSQLEAFAPVAVDDGIMQVLGPIVIQSDGKKVTDILG